MGGGTNQPGPARLGHQGLSPRGRGNRTSASSFPTPSGSIPAWAGEPFPGNGPKDDGLSPRGRGNRQGTTHRHDSAGSIPAWAGEPTIPAAAGVQDEVYPRVGGGTKPRDEQEREDWGLSPRGRGNPGRIPNLDASKRSIPAWAGEPGRPRGIFSKATVYPRVGGGTADTPNLVQSESGLSPRGRGNPLRMLRRPTPRGSIPAWAGEPQVRGSLREVDRVYPRVGGGTRVPWFVAGRGTGLSPRGRGNPWLFCRRR